MTNLAIYWVLDRAVIPALHQTPADLYQGVTGIVCKPVREFVSEAVSEAMSRARVGAVGRARAKRLGQPHPGLELYLKKVG